MLENTQFLHRERMGIPRDGTSDWQGPADEEAWSEAEEQAPNDGELNGSSPNTTGHVKPYCK